MMIVAVACRFRAKPPEPWHKAVPAVVFAVLASFNLVVAVELDWEWVGSLVAAACSLSISSVVKLLGAWTRSVGSDGGIFILVELCTLRSRLQLTACGVILDIIIVVVTWREYSLAMKKH